jgi:hypothetical protein
MYGPDAPEFAIAMNMALYVAKANPADSITVFLSPEVARQLSSILPSYNSERCPNPSYGAVTTLVGMEPFASELLVKKE